MINVAVVGLGGMGLRHCEATSQLSGVNLISVCDIDIDRVKEQAIAKHMSDIKVMSKLILSINEYIIRFGRTSNIHDQCFDLKAQVIKNRDNLQDWVNNI